MAKKTFTNPTSEFQQTLISFGCVYYLTCFVHSGWQPFWFGKHIFGQYLCGFLETIAGGSLNHDT